MTPGSSFARPLILSGADVVLPDRVLSPGTVIVEDGRVTEIETGARPAGSGNGAGFVDLHGQTLVAGFIDVHVHGVEGFDTLDSADAVEEIARRLVRYGVTAFCPTSVACSPDVLERLIESMRRARASARPHARVLPAHLESNFINPEFRGAQPLDCLRRPPRIGLDGLAVAESAGAGAYSGADVLRVIEAHRRDVGIVTLAVELDGGLHLAKALVAAGHRVSLGHSAATYEQALAGIAAGARHATHLFNRMSPLSHRAPGLTGAVLAEDAVAAEIICDGYHVHPAVATAAIRAKRVERIMAITDGSAGAGLPPGRKVSLGGRVGHRDGGRLLPGRRHAVREPHHDGRRLPAPAAAGIHAGRSQPHVQRHPGRRAGTGRAGRHRPGGAGGPGRARSPARSDHDLRRGHPGLGPGGCSGMKRGNRPHALAV